MKTVDQGEIRTAWQIDPDQNLYELGGGKGGQTVTELELEKLQLLNPEFQWIIVRWQNPPGWNRPEWMKRIKENQNGI